MPSLITQEQIQSAIAALPIQGQIMLKLLLLQHFDVTPKEIEYIAADRPDPRCVSGTKPTHGTLSLEAIQTVSDRRSQYRRQVRLRRERVWLEMECMRRLIALCSATTDQAQSLLAEKFGLSPDRLGQLRELARTAVQKPALRGLERRWDAGELSADDYQAERLQVEMQAQLRLAEKHRRRLGLAEREWTMINASYLQDHEIGHIWGIPAGALAARKVKFLHQYLLALQKQISTGVTQADPSTIPPLDLWKETLATLSQRPAERSIAMYDGLERTEEALVEKLEAFTRGQIPEEVENKFWLSLVHGASSNAVHSEPTRSLFGLQRLLAILNDMDMSPKGLAQELLARTAPPRKEDALELEATGSAPQPELTEMQQHILKSFIGEDRA